MRCRGCLKFDVHNLDEYAAQHFNLFGRNVYPYAAVFLEENGYLGGTITQEASAFYADFGYVAPLNESPDHLAIELNALAFLCGMEADAHTNRGAHDVHYSRQLQRQFLDEHLLRWLPAFAFGVEQQASDEVYRAIVRQALALTLEHRGLLGENLMPAQPFRLPNVPHLTDYEKTSLRDIARYLLTPVYTGFFLSQSDITRLGGILRLPHGFGKREQTLLNLLREAADYDLFDRLIAELEKLCGRWQKLYGGQHNVPQSIRIPWLERLQQTEQMLAELRQMAADHVLEGV